MSGHATLRRRCAIVMAFCIAVLAGLAVVHYLAAGLAAVVWWVLHG